MKKYFKSILCLVLALTLSFSLIGCGEDNSSDLEEELDKTKEELEELKEELEKEKNKKTTSDENSDDEKEVIEDEDEEEEEAEEEAEEEKKSDKDKKKEKDTYTVGVLQLVEHEALDEATQGFIDALSEAMENADKEISFNVHNASGDSTQCTTIANRFVSSDVDLIMANATPALQAAVAATADIPILGTSVTDYATALELKNWNGTVGFNVSGTSDLAPLNEQAKMLFELFPDATKVGLLYCSAEPNSHYQAKIIKEELKKLNPNIVCTDYVFSDSNDIYLVTQTAANNSDVIYIPTDNTAAANASIIGAVCYDAMVPVVTADEHTCSACGVACLSIDYYQLGVKTGEMAAKILLEGADISNMPIEYAPNPTKKFNPEICSELNVTIPEDYFPIY